MSYLRNTLVFGVALGLAAVAYGAEKQFASNGQAVIAASAMTDQPAPSPAAKKNIMHKKSAVHKKTIKHKKTAKHHVKKKARTKVLAKLDLKAINNASLADLEKAVNPDAAQRIFNARSALGGKFASIKQLKKEAKLTKVQYKKLTLVFSPNDKQKGEKASAKKVMPVEQSAPNSSNQY